MAVSKSLDTATGNGAGTALTLASVLRCHTIIVSYTGTPSSVHVNLEGSHDGTIWAVLDEFDYRASANTTRTVEASVDHRDGVA